MTDSPSPIDSSFDASDVATPCTVIAAKISLRNRNGLEEDQENLDSFDAFTETHETQESKNIAHGEHEEDVSNIYVDDFSKEFGDTVSSVMEPLPKPLTFARTITKVIKQGFLSILSLTKNNSNSTFQVYCHLDDQEHPYMVEVHVPPDCITLRDVKRKLMRTNFKYYCIALDPDTGL